MGEMMNIQQFCDKFQICRATFFRMKKRGDGPRLTRVSPRKIYISQAEAERWVKTIEVA